MTRYYVPFYKEPLFQLTGALTVIGFFISIATITGSSNAVNLTDGLDGLASGCVILVAGVLALVAFLSNNMEVSRYLNILYIEGASEIAVFLFATTIRTAVLAAVIASATRAHAGCDRACLTGSPMHVFRHWQPAIHPACRLQPIRKSRQMESSCRWLRPSGKMQRVRRSLDSGDPCRA